MDRDPIQQNVQGVRSLVSSTMNKTNSGHTPDLEGVSGDIIDEFTLTLSDEELLHLAQEWEGKYRGYEADIKRRQEENKKYYLGRQKTSLTGGSSDDVISANLLFEAQETFIPAALAKNPEPVVWADNTEEGNKLANDIKTMLQFHADQLVLRRKLALMVRHWSIYFLGIMKHGWDDDIQDIKSEVRDPQNFIFDPHGYVDCYGNYVGHLGERITVSANKLIEIFPKHKDHIMMMVNGKGGTDVTYTEWWTDEYSFTTFKDKILDKVNNPFFNYPKKTAEVQIDGSIKMVDKPQRNHFAKPQKPYTFLSVFTLGEQPHDITNLLEQNIPNQRRITRRTDQLDYNLSRANNSDVFSENNFNQETAKQAAQGMAKGHPILVPSGGPISEAIHRLDAPRIGSEFFKELETAKEDLRSIFGVQGITSQAPNEDTTARGMILQQQFDNSRIGGGIGDTLEQVADNIFNWWTQMYYVFYDEPHFAAIVGQMKATEFVTLEAMNLDRQLIVSVSPNSMKPKDELSEMNQAISLWQQGALDPKTLFTILNFPNPHETAGQVVLWRTNPQLYMQMNFPDIATIVQQQLATQQQAMVQSNQQAQGSASPQVGAEAPQELSANLANPALSNVPLPK